MRRRLIHSLAGTGLMRHAAGERLEAHAGLHVDQRCTHAPASMFGGVLENVAVHAVDQFVPETGFLQMRVDIDDQFVVVVLPLR